jgi:Tol biopolymer transport system component
VHRDFKPDNVLVARDGRQRVTDFGLARSAGDPDDSDAVPPSPDSPLDVSVTNTGTLVGTPAYMPPEQLDRQFDARSDQFSFCASLYEALFGALPFAGERLAEYMAAVVKHEVRPPPPGSPVPARVRECVLRGLSGRPDDRYGSMRELLDALAAAGRAPRRRRTRLLAPLLLVALAALGLAAWQWARPRRASTWRAEVRALGPAYAENADWVDFSPDGKRITYAADRDGGWRVYVADFPDGPGRAVSERAAGYPDFPRFTRDGKAILYGTHRVDGSELMRLDLATGRSEPIARDAYEGEDCPGGLLLLLRGAPVCPDCWRIVVRGTSDRELYRAPPGVEVRWPRCDRAGERVVFGVDDDVQGLRSRAALFVIGFDGRGLRSLFDGGVRNGYPTFHPDGRTILFSSYLKDGFDIWEIALAGGALRRITTGGFDYSPAVSPDGRLLVFNSDSTPWPLFAMRDGKRERVTYMLQEWLSLPVLTRDGRELIAAARGNGEIHLVAIDPSDGSERPLGPGNTPALARDDATLFLSERDGAGGRVMAQPRAGGARRLVARLPFAVTALTMGGDGALHASLVGPAGEEAWRVTLAGAAGREAPAPYTRVLVAPDGGWRAAALDGPQAGLELIAPGHAPGAADNRRLPRYVPSVWDADGRSLLAWGEGRLARIGLDGSVQPLFDLLPALTTVAVSADGKTVYASMPVGNVRREMVANFADRPR